MRWQEFWPIRTYQERWKFLRVFNNFSSEINYRFYFYFVFNFLIFISISISFWK